MNSLQAIIDHIEQFYNNHLQVKKVGSDFKEQLFNFATKDEKYPIVFAQPLHSLEVLPKLVRISSHHRFLTLL